MLAYWMQGEKKALSEIDKLLIFLIKTFTSSQSISLAYLVMVYKEILRNLHVVLNISIKQAKRERGNIIKHISKTNTISIDQGTTRYPQLE